MGYKERAPGRRTRGNHLLSSTLARDPKGPDVRGRRAELQLPPGKGDFCYRRAGGNRTAHRAEGVAAALILDESYFEELSRVPAYRPACHVVPSTRLDPVLTCPAAGWQVGIESIFVRGPSNDGCITVVRQAIDGCVWWPRIKPRVSPLAYPSCSS